MVTFFIALAALIVGFAVYAKVVERLLPPDDRKTPAIDHPDGVDYIPLPLWKSFLIQLLNIAGQSALVYDICNTLLGPVGAVLAMLGVIVCPITSGDTAFRSARLTLADWFGVDQKPHMKRLALSLRRRAVADKFPDYLALFLAVEPDARDDYAVDCGGLPRARAS